jgi:type II secretory pathway component PulL
MQGHPGSHGYSSHSSWDVVCIHQSWLAVTQKISRTLLYFFFFKGEKQQSPPKSLKNKTKTLQIAWEAHFSPEGKVAQIMTVTHAYNQSSKWS